MSDDRENKNGSQQKKTKTFITAAIFILAILVVILCLMSGVFDLGSNSDEPEETAEVSETPEPTETEDIYTISAKSGSGGYILYNNKQYSSINFSELKKGDTVTVQFYPEDGYAVDYVKINNDSISDYQAYYYNIKIDDDDIKFEVHFKKVETEPSPTPTETPEPEVTSEPEVTPEPAPEPTAEPETSEGSALDFMKEISDGLRN